MKDSLKQHIENSREDFELPFHDLEGVWDGVEHELNRKEKTSIFTIRHVWKVAAILIVGIGVSWFSFHQNAEFANYDPQLYKVSPELAETDLYYSTLIAQKMEVIQASKGKFDNQILEDIQGLDAVYQELKKDLQDNADNEEVVQALIEHHRLKLSILEKILEEIQNNEDENPIEI